MAGEAAKLGAALGRSGRRRLEECSVRPLDHQGAASKAAINTEEKAAINTEEEVVKRKHKRKVNKV